MAVITYSLPMKGYYMIPMYNKSIIIYMLKHNNPEKNSPEFYVRLAKLFERGMIDDRLRERGITLADLPEMLMNFAMAKPYKKFVLSSIEVGLRRIRLNLVPTDISLRDEYVITMALNESNGELHISSNGSEFYVLKWVNGYLTKIEEYFGTRKRIYTWTVPAALPPYANFEAVSVDVKEEDPVTQRPFIPDE